MICRTKEELKLIGLEMIEVLEKYNLNQLELALIVLTFNTATKELFISSEAQ